MLSLPDQIIAVSDAFGAATCRSRARVSTLVFNDGKRLDSVMTGHDIGIRTFERAMTWFSDNWPDGAEWPAGVPRPKSTKGRAA